jgi:hypothetical protein
MATTDAGPEFERTRLEKLRESLVHDFERANPPVTRAVVDEEFTRAVRQYDGAPVRDYVPVLAERAVRQRLQERSITDSTL